MVDITDEVRDSILHVDLDSLIDTRLATLIRYDLFDPEDIKDVGYYFNRIIDKFPKIGFDDFKELYRKRDKVTLRLGIGTLMNKFIKEFAYKTYEVPLSTPWKLRPKICVNVYPYKLTNEEKELIREGISTSIDHVCEVYITDMSNTDLTLEHVKKTYSVVVKYDTMEWMEINYGPLTEKDIGVAPMLQDIAFVTPALFYYDVKEDEKIDDSKNPFLDATAFYKILLDLQFYPVHHFCGVAEHFNTEKGRIRSGRNRKKK